MMQMQQMQMGPMGGMFDAEKAFAAERQQLGLVRQAAGRVGRGWDSAWVGPGRWACWALAAKRVSGLPRPN